jgi:phosphoserine phosphatase
VAVNADHRLARTAAQRGWERRRFKIRLNHSAPAGGS